MATRGASAMRRHAGRWTTAARAAPPLVAPLLLAATLGCAGRAAAGASSGEPPRRGGVASLATRADTIALGDAVFHGRVAGALCAVCHGQRGRGTPRAASLADTTWIHADGTRASILAIVERGVPGAGDAASMLPHGGVQLTAMQARAVAAYVHALGGGRP